MIELVAGVDVGGTNTVFALIDQTGKIHAQDSFPTAAHGKFEDYVKAIGTGIFSLSSALGYEHEIKAVGIGAPSANYYSGCIENAVNLIWPGILPVVEMLSMEMGGIPVVTTNDANAAAMGEMIYGGARNMKNFVVITLGTGLGSGFVVNGEVLYGNDGFAGEYGHIIYDRHSDRECGCGRKGCLETYVSATGIKRTALEMLALSNRPSALRQILPERLTSKDIAEAAAEGDELALRCFEAAGKALGEALADLVAVTAPEAIFLFGGVANAGSLIMEPVRKHFENSLLSMWKGKVKILFSSVDEASAAILGASALAWDHLRKNKR